MRTFNKRAVCDQALCGRRVHVCFGRWAKADSRRGWTTCWYIDEERRRGQRIRFSIHAEVQLMSALLRADTLTRFFASARLARSFILHFLETLTHLHIRTNKCPPHYNYIRVRSNLHEIVLLWLPKWQKLFFCFFRLDSPWYPWQYHTVSMRVPIKVLVVNRSAPPGPWTNPRVIWSKKATAPQQEINTPGMQCVDL